MVDRDLWEVLDSGVASAEKNMALDQRLLENLGQRQRPLIHFYDWERPSATYGVLVKLEEFVDVEAAKCLGVDFARRPTGGGIVFHIWDFAFSVLVPASPPFFSKKTLENYALINQAVLRAVKGLLSQNELAITPEDARREVKACQRFCMAMPTKYDVVLGDKKIAGAAQRQTKDGFLHQGTIALQMPDSELLRALLKDGKAIVAAMEQTTYPLQVDKEQLKEALVRELKKARS